VGGRVYRPCEPMTPECDYWITKRLCSIGRRLSELFLLVYLRLCCCRVGLFLSYKTLYLISLDGGRDFAQNFRTGYPVVTWLPKIPLRSVLSLTGTGPGSIVRLITAL
jgi:hypothetical protein